MVTKKIDKCIAIVTGSDSGIGKATAIAFAKEGADIVITFYSDRKGAQETAKDIEKEGQRSIIIKLDQKNSQEVERIFQETREKLGIPTILVNNAGIDSSGKSVKDMSIEEWDKEIRTNLYGPFLLL